jgi:hypothetical protein
LPKETVSLEAVIVSGAGVTEKHSELLCVPVSAVLR